MKFFHFQTMWKKSVFSCRNRKTCILREKMRENFLCFTRPLDILEKKQISQLIIFRQFWKMKKTFGLLPKFYRKFCQNCILRVLRNIMWIIFFFDEINISQILSILERAKKFSTFWPKILVVFKNCILPVHINFCKTNFFEKNMKYYLFWTLKEKSAYCRFCLTVLSTLQFVWPYGVSWKCCYFWRESDFGNNFDIDWNTSGLVAYFLWLGCQKCILRAHGNVLKGFNFFNWLYFFNEFLHGIKTFCFLPQFHRQICQNCILPVH